MFLASQDRELQIAREIIPDPWSVSTRTQRDFDAVELVVGVNTYAVSVIPAHLIASARHPEDLYRFELTSMREDLIEETAKLHDGLVEWKLDH